MTLICSVKKSNMLFGIPQWIKQQQEHNNLQNAVKLYYHFLFVV